MNKTIALLFIGLLLGLTIYVGWRLWRLTPGMWAVKAGVLLAFLAWMALFFISTHWGYAQSLPDQGLTRA